MLNKNFDETCQVASDLSSVMFLMFNPVRDELITGGVKGTKVRRFSVCATKKCVILLLHNQIYYWMSIHPPKNYMQLLCITCWLQNSRKRWPGYNSTMNICDMINWNESDGGNIVFEILAKTVFKFCYFILLTHWHFLHLCNQMFNFKGFASKWSILKLWECGIRNKEFKFFDKRFISLDHVTYVSKYHMVFCCWLIGNYLIKM